MIEAIADAQAKLVFCDNLYMYEPGPTGVLTEESPLRSTGKKSRLRARVAEDLLAAHRSAIVRATIGPSPDHMSGTCAAPPVDLAHHAFGPFEPTPSRRRCGAPSPGSPGTG